MRIMKRTIVYLIVVGLVLQGFGTKAFAANETDEIAKLNAVSGSGELLNQTAGEALPSPIIPLNSDEEAVLLSLENSNQALLGQKAAGGTATTRCSTDPNSGERSCKTVYEDDSPSSSSGSVCFSSPGTGAVCGCLTGALLGSLGGGPAAAAGCGVGGLLYYSLMKMRSN